MSITSLEQFNYKDCELIDPQQVNAYFDLSLDESDPTKLIFDNSWGTQILDLTPAIKAGETVTHLMLDPTTNPVYLRYDNEAGDSECIHGDDLSRIISMKYLKDVYQGSTPAAGDVYMMNADGYFHTYPLQTFINNVNSSITSLGNRVSSLENRMNLVENAITAINQTLNSLETRIHALEVLTTRPAGVPTDTVLAWGNRNVYGDISNTNSHAHGIFTHSISADLTDDLYFS